MRDKPPEQLPVEGRPVTGLLQGSIPSTCLRRIREGEVRGGGRGGEGRTGRNPLVTHDDL